MKAVSLLIATLLVSFSATAKISIDCVDAITGKNLHASIYEHRPSYRDGSTHWIEYKLAKGFDSAADGILTSPNELAFFEDGQKAFSLPSQILKSRAGDTLQVRTYFPSYTKLSCQVVVVDSDRGQ